MESIGSGSSDMEKLRSHMPDILASQIHLSWDLLCRDVTPHLQVITYAVQLVVGEGVARQPKAGWPCIEGK